MVLLAVCRPGDDFQVGLEPARPAARAEPAAPAGRLGAQHDQLTAALRDGLLDDQSGFGDGQGVAEEGDGWLGLALSSTAGVE